jgi:hypothetical protein
MRWLLLELAAVLAAAAFALLALGLVSADENVAFFVALIGSIAVWEAARFLMLRSARKA